MKDATRTVVKLFNQINEPVRRISLANYVGKRFSLLFYFFCFFNEKKTKHLKQSPNAEDLARGILTLENAASFLKVCF